MYTKKLSTHSILAYLLCLCEMFSVLMVLIKQRSSFVILPILNHVKRLKPSKRSKKSASSASHIELRLAPGAHGILAELLKYAIDAVNAALHQLFVRVWRSGKVPGYQRDGIIITRKGFKNECGNRGQSSTSLSAFERSPTPNAFWFILRLNKK